MSVPLGVGRIVGQVSALQRLPLARFARQRAAVLGQKGVQIVTVWHSSVLHQGQRCEGIQRSFDLEGIRVQDAGRADRCTASRSHDRQRAEQSLLVLLERLVTQGKGARDALLI